MNETCPIHPGEQLVAIDGDKNKLGCERCVYEGFQEEPRFISMFARSIKDEFDIEYERYIANQISMDDFSPPAIIHNIKS